MKTRNYLLVTDTSHQMPNPGDIWIGNGIEWLITQACIQRDIIPVFNYVSLFDRSENIWKMAEERVDAVVVCGTPQFNSEGVSAHFVPLLKPLTHMKNMGKKVYNLYCGSGTVAHDYTNEEYLVKRMQEPSKDIIKLYGELFNLIIARDSITHKLLLTQGTKNEQLLCSVFYAKDYYGITPKEPKWNLIVLRGRGDIFIATRRKNIAFEYEKLMDSNYPTFYVLHGIEEYEMWAKAGLPKEKIICSTAPRELLEVYANANQVLSQRVHATVPAISLGKKVQNIATDSRSKILEYVDIKSNTLSQWENLELRLNFVKVENIDEVKKRNELKFIELFNQKDKT